MSMETKAQQQVSSDAYDLAYFEMLKNKTTEIRKSPNRFAAAIKYIKKENEELRKAMQKENVQRDKAMKK